MADFEIADASLDDADAIWELTSAFAVSFVPERTAFDLALESLIAREDGLLAVATTPSGVAGYALAVEHPALFANGPLVWVEELMVHERLRRLGAGRLLMDAVEGWAWERGAVYVSLATRRAHDFYTALGYEESATFYRKLSP